MVRVEREREIAQRRSRKAKLKKLRAKFVATDDRSAKAAVLAKARKISPFIDFEAEAAK